MDEEDHWGLKGPTKFAEKKIIFRASSIAFFGDKRVDADKTRHY